MEKALPVIPAKRYFTIGEVSDLCCVKPHVLRYWEQEFSQLRPMKRRGNRRYYQHHEVLMIRRIRDLLYDQGFTISGARNKMQELLLGDRDKSSFADVVSDGLEVIELTNFDFFAVKETPHIGSTIQGCADIIQLRQALHEIREILTDRL
jgi:DNA-binding transcriptional MerR regulator